MRKCILAVQVLILVITALTSAFAQGKTTIDPNTLGNKPAIQNVKKDPRLDQKITYQVKLRPIADMANDLTQLTGITFIAGRNKSDWRVREDCTTIMAKDIALSSLMNSIAHVMKYKWVKTGDAPNWTYRLVEDSAAIAKAKRQEEELKKRGIAERRKCWDMLIRINNMSEDELELIKEDEPILYLQAKTGILASYIRFIQQVPAIKDAFIAGDELKLFVAWLPAIAQQALRELLKSSYYLQSQFVGYDTSDNDYLATLENSKHTSIRLFKRDAPSQLVRLDMYMPEISEFFSFGSAQSDVQRLREKVALKAYEDERSYDEIYKEMKPQIDEARKKRRQEPEVWISSYTQESFLDHPEDPALSEPLKKEIATNTITDLIASLADTTGFAIVTDDFRDGSKFTIAKGTKFQEVLNDISKSCYYNWNKNSHIIELWNVNWYENREARVSNVWREKIRRKLQETGTLDIDDLAEIALLTDRQIYRLSNDDILKYARDVLWTQCDYLKIYASLTSPQRSILLSNSGMAFTDLTSDQQQSVMKLVMARSIPELEGLDFANIGLRITCTKEPLDKGFRYTFKAYTSLGELPGKYCFQTPTYTAPPKPKDKKE